MREGKGMCRRQGSALNMAQQSLPFYKWEMKKAIGDLTELCKYVC